DRCNIRCFYCMPNGLAEFLPREQLLTYEEIEEFVRAVTPLGISKLRITGGEPLVRAELPKLIRRLTRIEEVAEVALTSNGILLTEQAEELRRAGLHRLNVSLDALSEAAFRQIARRPGVDRVLSGIAAAQSVGFQSIRLNAVALRGISESEISPLVRFAREHDLELRFIEFMPLDAERNWRDAGVLTGADVRKLVERDFGPLQPVERRDASQPAIDYEFLRGGGRIGFINSLSEPFCGDCNRLRITAEGQVRNCLFSTTEWDARRLLRNSAGEDAIRKLVRRCVAAKAEAHGVHEDGFQRPERAMYQIGG
ncbi:MAG: GTP 3',8-cyclase MoaA, partial [Planctomycetota bacterium]